MNNPHPVPNRSFFIILSSVTPVAAVKKIEKLHIVRQICFKIDAPLEVPQIYSDTSVLSGDYYTFFPSPRLYNSCNVRQTYRVLVCCVFVSIILHSNVKNHMVIHIIKVYQDRTVQNRRSL